MIHLARAVQGKLRVKSNVFEMFGVDFMLDDELNLWFIEANMSPQFLGTNEYKSQFLRKMFQDLFEIEYSYYRSRMTRVLAVLRAMNKELKSGGDLQIEEWKSQYSAATKNRLEPEYQISPKNEFVLIVDKNLDGAYAYGGLLEDDCAKD